MNQTEVKSLFSKLRGNHRRTRREKLGNWYAAALLAFGPTVVVAVCEAWIRGWSQLQFTPLVAVVLTLSLLYSGYRTHHHNQEEYRFHITHLERWSRRAHGRQTLRIEEIVNVELKSVRGAWILVFALVGGRSETIALTKSMKERLAIK